MRSRGSIPPSPATDAYGLDSITFWRTTGQCFLPHMNNVCQKSSRLKLFAIFSLMVNLCNWKLPWLLPKRIPRITPILVYLSEYLYELYHFYRAACNADAVLWWEFCPSVRPSVPVCPSVTRVYCDKTVERSVQIYIPYERTFSLVFWEEEWLVGGPLLREILGQPAPVGTKSPIFNQ